MSNYPEGVTGLESAIVGGESYDVEETLQCSQCAEWSDVEFEATYFDDDGVVLGDWVCTKCDYDNSYEHYPAFDYYDNDEWRDR